MYYKLDNDEFERIKEIEKITFSDFELVGNFIPVESMMAALEDMLVEYHNKEEELEDLQENIKDNYKPISNTEMYGVSDRDFM